MLRRIFKDCMTEDDGKTYDIDCFGYAIGLTAYLILAAITYHQFNPLEFAGGLVAILAGRSVSEAYRKRKS